MKKFLALFLALLTVVLSTPMAVASTDFETENNLSYSSDNTIGDTIVNAMNESVNKNGGYGVFGLSIGNLVAAVSLSAPDNSTLLVSVYDEETNRMVTSGKAKVNSDTRNISVALAECTLPDYYIIKAFILNSDNSPVCNHFENREFTKAYEEFFAKDIYDFEEEKVLNFDAGYESNFAVVSNDSTVITYEENKNMVVTDDYENGIYVFENADEKITSLTYGDILYYVYGEGPDDYILTKVGEIKTEDSLTTVIAADECEMGELFAYIDIDTSKLETPQTYRASFDDESGQINEEKSYPITSGSKQKDFSGKNFSLKLSVSGDVTFKIKFQYDFELFGEDYYKFEYWVEVNANATATFNANGSFKKKCTIINTDIAIFFGIDVHVEINVTFKASASLTVTGTIDFSMKNGASRESGGVQKKIEQKPIVKLNLDIDGNYSISVIPELVTGFKVLKVFHVDLTVPVDFNTSGTLYVPTSSQEREEHSCSICIDGEVSATVKLNITVKFGLKKKTAETIINVSPVKKTFKLGEYYISLNNGIKFAWGECPDISGDGSDTGSGSDNNDSNENPGFGGTSFWEEVINRDITGKCGYNLTWTLYTDGELIISGTGDMTNYASETEVPWYKYKDRIERVVIEKGVTSIGDYAFYRHLYINHVSINADLTRIGCFSFYEIWYLTDIKLPKSLKIIDEGAFYGSSLTKIDIPESVEVIGNKAFYWCNNLSGIINISKNVKTIGKNAFVYCSGLKKIIVHKDNPYYCSDEKGVLFNKDKTVLMQNPSGNYISYTIPDSVVEISSWAFSYGGATNVKIPDSVKVIGEGAFCLSAVKKIVIPNGITTMDYWSFSSHNIKEIYIPDSVKYIDEKALDCDFLETIYFGGTKDQWTSIGFNTNNSTTQIIYNYAPEDLTDSLEEKIELAASFRMTRSASVTSEEIQTITKTKVITSTVIDHGYLIAVIKNAKAENLFSADNLLFVDQKIATDTTLSFAYTIPLDTFSHTVIIFSADLTSQNHQHDYTVTGVEATCTQEGGTLYSCICGDEYMENVTEAPGHNYTVSSISAPTCTSKGYTTYSCKCGYTENADYVNELPHEYESVITTEPTHIKEGIKTFTCECGHTYTETIDKTKEHTYNTEIIAPTCTETGYTIYLCACDYRFEDDYVAETGHTDNDNDGICDNCSKDLTEGCPCNCHKNGFMGIIWKILRFFYKLFGMKQYCSCGIAHY